MKANCDGNSAHKRVLQGGGVPSGVLEKHPRRYKTYRTLSGREGFIKKNWES